MTICEVCLTPLPDTPGVTMQQFTIEDWHPANFQLAGHGGRGGVWRAARERKEAWGKARTAAELAGWLPVIGKALVDVTYVYQANYRTDIDNLIHRLKGLLDGLKTIPSGKYKQLGWFEDDSTDLLDLRVHKLVERGRKALVVKLYGAIDTMVSNERTTTTCSNDSEPSSASSSYDVPSVWTTTRRTGVTGRTSAASFRLARATPSGSCRSRICQCLRPTTAGQPRRRPIHGPARPRLTTTPRATRATRAARLTRAAPPVIHE